MIVRIVVALIVIFVSTEITAQRFFTGTVSDAQTGEPLAYANVYNVSSGQGTISNAQGYFRIQLTSSADTIRVSYIGFETLRFLQSRAEEVNITMVPSSLELNEVTILPPDDDWLYEFVAQARKEQGDGIVTSRAYYNLKSFLNQDQVELVEAYYNASLEGVELNNVQLKAGRIALNPAGDRIFISFESSRAITGMRLIGKQSRFPVQPMELNKPQLRKAFFLSVDQQYLNDAGDSVLVIRYQPKDTGGTFFAGLIWVNQTTYAVEKITMLSDDAKQHPFDALFPGDSIHRVQFQITKTFDTFHGRPVLRHIDFFYEIDYQSRVGYTNEKSFTIRTEAVLYAYRYGEPFTLPAFEFHPATSADYWQIHTFPYNDFFWKNHTDYSLYDRERTEEFYSRHKYLSLQQTFDLPDARRPLILFEKPFRIWSRERVGFREPIPVSESTYIPAGNAQCHLAVKIFADLNVYGDSSHVLTATIFDPFESNCNLPMDPRANCFVNMYFDYCEILRRNLVDSLRHVQTEEDFRRIHTEFSGTFDRETQQFLNEVKYGHEKKSMEAYNAMILTKLGIDNIAIFKPFETQEEK